jgi:hypothetical protein
MPELRKACRNRFACRRLPAPKGFSYRRSSRPDPQQNPYKFSTARHRASLSPAPDLT